MVDKYVLIHWMSFVLFLQHVTEPDQHQIRKQVNLYLSLSHTCGNGSSVKKIERFLVGGGEIGEQQSRHSNSECNFSNIYFLRKVYTRCTMASGTKPPEAGDFSRIFPLNVCKVVFNCKLQKNWGSRMYCLFPQ